MCGWDAKVAFGVRLASLYPIQLLLPGDSGVCFLPPSSGFFQTLKEKKSSSHSWSASKKLIVITGGRSALHLSKGKRAMIPCYHVWLGCQSCIRGPSGQSVSYSTLTSMDIWPLIFAPSSGFFQTGQENKKLFTPKSGSRKFIVSKGRPGSSASHPS